MIVCLMGPTASGKTQLAIELVKRYPFEIISVDSAMVYRGMNIGTAKPEVEVLAKAPHRLIDIAEPEESYSAAAFCRDVKEEIDKIQSNHKIPLLVGGTMLYFRALQQGIAAMPSSDPKLRQQLLKEAEIKGWPALHAELNAFDPESASRIHPHDSQRIQRALEVYKLSGKNLSTWQKETVSPNTSTDMINIILMPGDRKLLHARIAERFQQMLNDGLIEEVQQLMMRPKFDVNLPSMRSVGYAEAIAHIQGKYTYGEMCEKSIVATRQLAKRQMTWLRHWPDAHCFDSDLPNVYHKVCEFLDSTFTA